MHVSITFITRVHFWKCILEKKIIARAEFYFWSFYFSSKSPFKKCLKQKAYPLVFSIKTVWNIIFADRSSENIYALHLFYCNCGHVSTFIISLLYSEWQTNGAENPFQAHLSLISENVYYNTDILERQTRICCFDIPVHKFAFHLREKSDDMKRL